MDDFREQLPKLGLRVVEVHGSGIEDPARLAVGGRLHVAGSKNRQPDDISLQVGAGDGLESVLLNFGGPPKTNASGGVEQKEQPDFPYVSVKFHPKRRKVSRETRDRHVSWG